MYALRSAARVAARSLAFAALLLVLSLPHRARAQETFAIGVAGSLVNDTGTASNVGSFGTAGAHLFGEMKFDRWGVLQARLSRFGLPGTAPDAPNLVVDSATLTVGYLFQEDWFRAGVYAGVGGYRLRPRDLEAGQVPVDDKENVFGWTGGLITIFDVAPHWDLRLEASGHLIRTVVGHKPILITAGVAYRF